ncbi:FHA domain-containing protein, partial [Streptomyces sp. SID13726]|uniref:FHA domain-containing protein n=1 Tax=Streptomyces sp. SID13726 TaxID=2706058 RepID=UPI001EF1F128
MQIRLTVVDPLGPPDRARGRAASCDVLVTAPVGTALSAVASALASAVSGNDGPVVLYADGERLDDRRATLGEPPLIDGAVLSLGAPAAPEPHPELDDAPTQLHVVAGPDAGGVHLLHGGQIHIGRSADADVPLDDPDVSRLHCAVTVAADGRVSVADLGSTNGTALDGTRVGTRPVRFPPGALLRIGESVLRLAPSGGPRLGTEPDGEGHVRVAPGESAGPESPEAAAPGTGPGREVSTGRAASGSAGSTGPAGLAGDVRARDERDGPAREDRGGPAREERGRSAPPADRTHHAYGSAGWGASGGGPEGAGVQGHGPVEPPVVVPGQGGAPRIENRGGTRDTAGAGPGPVGDTHGGRSGVGSFDSAEVTRTTAAPTAPQDTEVAQGRPERPTALQLPHLNGLIGATADHDAPAVREGRHHRV